MGKKIYPYAVARIRMLERSLLTEKNYLQMIDAKNADEALRILQEAGGYGEANQLLDIKTYEEALSRKLERAYADVRELVPKDRFMDVFLYKNDYHNLKVLIKAEISGNSADEYLIDGGTVGADVLKHAFSTRKFDGIPYAMQEAMNQAYDAYANAQSGQAVDIVLDRAIFRQMNQTAKSCGSDFIRKYVEYVCDITNLKNFYRVKMMKKPFEVMADVYIEGGSMGIDTFKSAFNAENAWSGLKSTPYGEMCAEGMPKGFTVFERLCDNFIMKYIKDARYKSLTMEPLVAYIYARETEVKTVRIIMSGKINNIDADVIKERLRDAYV